MESDERDTITMNWNINTLRLFANSYSLNDATVWVTMMEEIKGDILSVNTLGFVIPLVTAEICVTIIFHFR